MENKELKRRIIDISYIRGLSHLGSNLSAVDIIKEIYDTKKDDDKFVLSSGHAGLALYAVLESRGGRNAEEIFDHHGVHPDRCVVCGICVSAGSLGHGLPIALGMALADRDRDVYCLISDGEFMEGSISEALRIRQEQKVDNLKVYLNYNGYGAYRDIVLPRLDVNVRRTTVEQFPFLRGLDAHYYTMTQGDYRLACELLE